MGLFRNRRYLATGGSPGKNTWRQLLRNPVSLASMVFIGLAAGIAVAGYLVSPDHTPFANRQTLEISTKKPGFRVDILKIRKNRPSQARGWLGTMLFGSPDDHLHVPVDTLVFSEESIRFRRYTGDSIGIWEEVSLADAVLPLSTADSLPAEAGTYLLADSSLARINKAELESEARKQLTTRRFLLGTDRFGRDLLSRLLIGTRVSLSVGLIAVFISLLLGISLGSLAGFFKGRTDDAILWLINVVWSIPTLLLVIAITFALGKGFWQVFVAVGLTMWVEVARVVRGQILSIREKEYVEAARALGYSSLRIIRRHILPNVMAPVIVISAANFASAILIEAGLSFLGIGVQPPMPSWGTMIRENYAYIILDKAYLAVMPGLCIMLLVLAFMLLGNTLRDVLDVRYQPSNG